MLYVVEVVDKTVRKLHCFRNCICLYVSCQLLWKKDVCVSRVLLVADWLGKILNHDDWRTHADTMLKLISFHFMTVKLLMYYIVRKLYGLVCNSDYVGEWMR